MRLSTLSFAYLRERKGRAAVAGSAIALGVALAVAAPLLHLANVRHIDGLIRDGAGATDVVAVPTGLVPGAGLAEAEVARLRDLPGVRAAVGVLSFGAAVDGPSSSLSLRVNRAAPARLFAFDFAAAQSIYEPRLREGRLPAGAGREVVVPPRLAERVGATTGSTIEVATPTGREALQVVGILEDVGVARVQFGNGIFTTLATGQLLGGSPGAVNLIAVDLAPGVETARWIRAHSDVGGDVLTFEDASEAERFARRQVSATSGAFGGIAVIVLFLAGFMIHLALGVEVAERASEHGTIRAVGGTPSQLRRVVIAEAALLSACAVPVGLALGALLAVLAVRVNRSDGYEGVPHVVWDWRAFAIAAGSAVAITLLASTLPARRAGRLQPVVAIRGGSSEQPRSRRTTALGVVVVSLGLGLLIGAPSPLRLAVGLVAMLSGTVLVAPALVGLAADAMSRPIRRRPTGPRGLAMLHLSDQRTRAAHTTSLIAIVLAIVFAVGAVETSARAAISDQIDQFFGADFELEAASSFEPEFADRVRGVRGVDKVSSRITTATGSVAILDLAGETASVQMIDPSTYFGIGSFSWIDGDDASAVDALTRGGHVLIPDLMASRLRKKVGDTLTLATPTGAQEFTIAATMSSPSTNPVLVVSLADGRSVFGATRPTSVLVDAAPGSEPTVVRTRIEEQLGDDEVFIAVTASSLKADVQAQLDGAITGFAPLVVLAVIVGALGLANTLAVSVLHRRREIGMLRSVGALPSQVALVSAVEAACLAALSLTMAVPLGHVIARPLLRVLSAALGEHSVTYAFPWSWLPLMAVAAVVVATVAAFSPARRAAKLLPVAALRFE